STAWINAISMPVEFDRRRSDARDDSTGVLLTSRRFRGFHGGLRGKRFGRFEKDAAQENELIVSPERPGLAGDRVEVHFIVALNTDEQARFSVGSIAREHGRDLGEILTDQGFG